MRDSLANVKSIPQVDVNKEYEHLKDQYDLALLEKRDQLKTVYLLAIILFSAMAICILLIVWYNLKRSRKNVTELTSLNNQISQQNTQIQKALSALEQSQEDNTRMMLELLKTSGQNSLELVNDLLQMHTRAEELKKEPVDLSLMLHYCVDLLHFKAEAKRQHIDLQAKPVTLSVNREKMWRVVSNLIANAIKFSPSGAAILVQMEKKLENVLIAVEDHGIGIPAEMKDKIFDMFTEAKRPGTAGEQPFGLGLAISTQIVEAHGGNIWFDSKPGNGTTFYVALPV